MVTEGGEDKLMEDVVVGDKIRAVDSEGNIVFSEVLMFLDRDTEEARQFLKIQTEEGSVLTLTPNHLLPTHLPKPGQNPIGHILTTPAAFPRSISSYLGEANGVSTIPCQTTTLSGQSCFDKF